MKHLLHFIYATLLVIALIFSSCKKEKTSCYDDELFCSFVDSRNYSSTGPLINTFLQSLPKGDSDEKKLKKLQEWLHCKSCTGYAEIVCNSCVPTTPPQSQLLVYFSSSGQSEELTMHVMMGNYLRFAGYYE
jgi:hypothetical protein